MLEPWVWDGAVMEEICESSCLLSEKRISSFMVADDLIKVRRY